MSHSRRLISVAHSYVISLNRRLCRELAHAGGQEWSVTAVAPKRFLNSNNGELVAMRPERDTHFRLEEVDVRWPRSPHVFTYGRKLKKLLADGWDMVHCWEEPYVAAGWQLSRQTPREVPFVFWTAQNIHKRYPPPFNWFERATVERSDGWLACGRSILETMLDRPRYAERPYQLSPLGVDTDQFAPSVTHRASTLRHLNWADSGPPVIGFLGRFVPEKGLDVLLSALRSLRSEWRLLLVGDGPMKASLEAFARATGDRVRICTDVNHDQVPAYLNAMDVLAAPSLTTASWREQFGRMITEAMSCGVPVVGSDSGEIPHVIGAAGVIAREAVIDEWVNSLGALIDSPARRAALHSAGRDRVLTRYSWPVIARETLSFFQRILDSRGRTSR